MFSTPFFCFYFSCLPPPCLYPAASFLLYNCEHMHAELRSQYELVTAANQARQGNRAPARPTPHTGSGSSAPSLQRCMRCPVALKQHGGGYIER